MIQTFFNREIIAASWPIVLVGLRNTVFLSLLVVPLGLICEMILALLASVKNPAVRWPLMAGSISSAPSRPVPAGQVEAAFHRPLSASDHGLRRAASGRAQRAARPAL